MLKQLSARLSQYDEQEARSIVRLLLECCFGISFTDICAGKLDSLSPDEQTRLETYMQRLEQGEPVQYVIGYAPFCGREFIVRPGVLIPRPETEELCEWVIKDENSPTPTLPRRDGVKYEDENQNCETFETQKREIQKPSILDIGTGSGCIAITLAASLPNSQVTAWDVSEEALSVARENAKNIGTSIHFEKVDMLNNEDENENSETPETLKRELLRYGDGRQFDIIVSNPPYICDSEASQMDSHVLDHEPHTALFVPDDDPLLFYRHIAQFATKSLKPHGHLYFEINPLYAVEIQQMLSTLGFHDIDIRKDQFSKQRMIRASRTTATCPSDVARR